MTITNLYIYYDSGSLIITPVQRNPEDPVSLYRLIADAGMILHNTEDDTTARCIDTANKDIWEEIEDTDPPETVE